MDIGCGHYLWWHVPHCHCQVFVPQPFYTSETLNVENTYNRLLVPSGSQYIKHIKHAPGRWDLVPGYHITMGCCWATMKIVLPISDWFCSIIMGVPCISSYSFPKTGFRKFTSQRTRRMVVETCRIQFQISLLKPSYKSTMLFKTYLFGLLINFVGN